MTGQAPVTWSHRTPGARTLIVTFGGLPMAQTVGRTHLHELAEVLTQVERADVLTLRRPLATPADRLRARLERRLPALRLLPRAEPAPLDRDYELLVVVCQDPSDVRRLGPIDAWRRRCARAICIVGEVWVHELPTRADQIDLLSRFDGLFTFCRGSVAPLAAALRDRTPVRWWAPALDTLRFRPPADAAPDRCIDIYSVGRRVPRMHEALLDLSARRGWFYLYSTTLGQRVPDPAEHRRRLASLIQRTRYFVVQPARAGDPAAKGQEEVGTRYLEGAAGGAVLIGQAPRCPGYREMFDWPDAVIALPSADDPRFEEVLAELDDDPERVARARAAGMAGALRRFDVSHRWRLVLDLAGLEPDPALLERRARLQAAEAEVLASVAHLDAPDPTPDALETALHVERSIVPERPGRDGPAALGELCAPSELLGTAACEVSASGRTKNGAVGAALTACPDEPGGRSSWRADGRA